MGRGVAVHRHGGSAGENHAVKIRRVVRHRRRRGHRARSGVARRRPDRPGVVLVALCRDVAVADLHVLRRDAVGRRRERRHPHENARGEVRERHPRAQDAGVLDHASPSRQGGVRAPVVEAAGGEDGRPRRRGGRPETLPCGAEWRCERPFRHEQARDVRGKAPRAASARDHGRR